ncbi:MAG: alpha/beta hydrolase [Thermoplasmata archaeon]|nr:alpha/beta hydrolase [Thermoplasmata archaeon]
MPPREREVRHADGRTLRVVEDGDLHGRPVFVLHGSPCSRLLYQKHVDDATRRGVRLIGHDRPGYGGSSPQPGRTIGDEAADVRAIADELGIERFGVWGFSGGGAPSLACAALLPERVAGAACLAGVAPYPAEGLDWFAGMGEANVEDFRRMMDDPKGWESGLRAAAQQLSHATLEEILTSFASLLSEVDRAALTGGVAEILRAQIAEGVRPGIDGWRDDSLAGTRPWGFELSQIRVPLQIWHGRHDRFVPFTHGQWLASRLPKAEHHLLPNDGHVTLFEDRIPAVHEWLVHQF